MMGWIKDDLGPSKQGKTRQIYPKYAARGGSGGVLEGFWRVLECLGQGFWMGLRMMGRVKDDFGTSKGV